MELRRLDSGRHTDRVGATRLAKLLALDAVPAVWVPLQSTRKVRRLLTCQERLGSYRRALGNQARLFCGAMGSGCHPGWTCSSG